MTTILDALTSPTAAIDASPAPPGGNTLINTTIDIESWVPWLDFNYANLTRIFASHLSATYHGSPEPQPLVKDLLVSNETAVDDTLRRFPVPTVNYALNEVAGSPHFGRGTRVFHTDYQPDWSVVSDEEVDENGVWCNLLPGESKIGSKWFPEMANSPDEYTFVEWQKVLRQAVTYSATFRSRYGFSVTDDVDVVLRISRVYTGPGLARGRPQRTTVVPPIYGTGSPTSGNLYRGGIPYLSRIIR
ncbi:hypothetical protein VTK73DRAFT_7435 [Phialemonium thermophilum]|uniref:Uncharacterized protein n=1 Tax=Phialemonium thermophilum TaxID=223376 RepID=A0ABR3WEL2_9PEZI